MKFLLTSAMLLMFTRMGFSWIDLDALCQGQNIITSTKKISFSEFPNAYNPSIIKNDRGFLLTFRYAPDLYDKDWISYIGIVQLDTEFDPISSPMLLNTRTDESKTPSQAEDARIFCYKNRLFLIFNDNLEVTNPQRWQRRDMYIAELVQID